jgi:hypothetical protein
VREAIDFLSSIDPESLLGKLLFDNERRRKRKEQQAQQGGEFSQSIRDAINKLNFDPENGSFSTPKGQITPNSTPGSRGFGNAPTGPGFNGPTGFGGGNGATQPPIAQPTPPVNNEPGGAGGFSGAPGDVFLNQPLRRQPSTLTGGGFIDPATGRFRF